MVALKVGLLRVSARAGRDDVGHRVRLVVARELHSAAAIGPWSNWMNNQRWEEIFWLIAVVPVVGIAVWLVLSRDQTAPART